jgi:hypothetical protein
LSTNRLYTHEIRAAQLNAEQLPTRLGYVIRCSTTKAKFENKMTVIENPETGKYVPLVEPTAKDVKNLKDLYFAENVTTDKITYGFLNFSLNKGDYLAPKV